MSYLSDSEVFAEILNYLKKINSNLEDVKASINDNHELLISKLSVLETISDSSRDFLESIHQNTTP